MLVRPCKRIKKNRIEMNRMEINKFIIFSHSISIIVFFANITLVLFEHFLVGGLSVEICVFGIGVS